MAVVRTKTCDVCLKEFRDESRGNTRKRCKGCVPDMKAHYIFMKYGITQSQWNEMYVLNGGLCPLCKNREATHVDHCHMTNKVRGLLCKQCNAHLGWLEKKEWLENALAYLEVNK